MKKILSLVIVVIMLFSLSIAAYGEDSNVEENEVQDSEIELTLEDAIKYALEYSRDIKIQELDIKRAELQYEQSKSDIRDFEEQIEEYENLPSELKFLMRGETIPIIEKNLLELGVLERQAKLSKQISIWNREIKENEIKYNVEKAYFDLLQREKELELANEGLELAKNQYEQSKKMYELGNISNQQLLSVELAVAQAQSSVDMAEMAYQIQLMNFNNILGLPLESKVKLLDKIEEKEYEEIDLEKVIETAMENSAVIKVAQENYELAELTFKAVKAKHVTPNQYKYREQEIAVEQAAKALENTRNGVEMAVRASYYNLVAYEKQIKTYEKAVENAQSSYELAELSYNLGKNTSSEVTQALIDLMSAKKNLSNQIHAYNMALLDFKYSIGLGKNMITGF